MGDELITRSETSMTINPEALISKGIESGLSIEGMQKLLDMRKQIKDEYAKEEFFKALSKFQAECPTIEKKKAVMKNGAVRYHYAPLEDIVSQVKRILEANGFSYTLKTRQSDKSLTVLCEAHHKAGHTEITEITVPAFTSEHMTAVQNVGSATTYAKRYSFCNAFGIMTGDEDTDGADHDDDKNPEPAKTTFAPKPSNQSASQPSAPQQSAPAPQQPGQFPYMLKAGDVVPAWFMSLPFPEKKKWAPEGFSISGGKLCVRKAS